jgi:hypothetical protein
VLQQQAAAAAAAGGPAAVGLLWHPQLCSPSLQLKQQREQQWRLAPVLLRQAAAVLHWCNTQLQRQQHLARVLQQQAAAAAAAADAPAAALPQPWHRQPCEQELQQLPEQQQV